jgi:hypothetical protein
VGADTTARRKCVTIPDMSRETKVGYSFLLVGWGRLIFFGRGIAAAYFTMIIWLPKASTHLRICSSNYSSRDCSFAVDVELFYYPSQAAADGRLADRINAEMGTVRNLIF